MCRRNEVPARRVLWVRKTRAAAVLAVASLSCCAALALDGVTTTRSAAPIRQIAAAERPTHATGTHQIRCWQQGKLLFEETQVTLSAQQVEAWTRLEATDRHQQPLYVVDTRSGLCLVQSIAPAVR